MPVAKHLPRHRLELWCHNGVHLSNNGVTTLLRLLQDLEVDHQFAVDAPLPATSIVGQCKKKVTAPESVAQSSAEPQAFQDFSELSVLRMTDS